MDELFTPESCRAARALLAISQNALAARAGVSRLTVAGFEDGSRRPMPANRQALRATLESSGVVFVPGGARLGGPFEPGRILSDQGGGQRLALVLRKLQRSSSRLQSMGVRHVVVFGSTARGEAEADSDVDLAIDIDAARNPDLLDLAGIVGEIQKLLGLPVDVARQNRLLPEVARCVAREGIRAF